MAQLAFCLFGEKNMIIRKKKLGVTTYYYFFLRENKIRKKTLSVTPYLEKTSCEKTKVLVQESSYLLGRYLQRVSTPLSPNVVSTSLVEGNMTNNQLRKI